MDSLEQSLEDLYKNEASKILAVLVRIFGPHNFELAEDVLQEAFSKAFVEWQENQPPKNKTAWLIQVAKNKAIDFIRANKTKTKFSADLSQYLESEWSLKATVEKEFNEANILDDQLRMIFMCCTEDIKPENRLPFILKNLCGFSLTAVSRALLLKPETVKKRLTRTKESLKTKTFSLPPPEQLIHAMDSVHTVLYLLFNEGYHSSQNEQAMNLDLCYEAINLTFLLTNEPRVVNQDTLGLLALMRFHLSRASSKVGPDGFNIPINLQDRSLWNQNFIQSAVQILNFSESIPPGASNRFLLEALIAKEHCLATDFEKTNWQKIEELYRELVKITASPVTRLNLAIAKGYNNQLQKAIEETQELITHKALKSSHLPVATLAHLYAKAGNADKALKLASQAKKKGGTAFEHQLMDEQLKRLLPQID